MKKKNNKTLTSFFTLLILSFRPLLKLPKNYNSFLLKNNINTKRQKKKKSYFLNFTIFQIVL